MKVNVGDRVMLNFLPGVGGLNRSTLQSNGYTGEAVEITDCDDIGYTATLSTGYSFRVYAYDIERIVHSGNSSSD